MQLHIKGRILQLLEERGPLWDYEVFELVATEYSEVEGQYWYDTLRLVLADLYSSGLTKSIEETLDPGKSFGVEKILFRFELTAFGRERMRHTGLSSGRRQEVAA